MTTDTPRPDLTTPIDDNMLDLWEKVARISPAGLKPEALLRLVSSYRDMKTQLAAERSAGRKELADDLFGFLSDGDMDSVVQGIQRAHYGEPS